MYRVVQRN